MSISIEAISLIYGLAAALVERDKPMTEKEAGEYMGVSAATVRRWTDAGTLASVRYPGALVRYRPSQLEEFIAVYSIKRPRKTAADTRKPEV